MLDLKIIQLLILSLVNCLKWSKLPNKSNIPMNFLYSINKSLTYYPRVSYFYCSWGLDCGWLRDYDGTSKYGWSTIFSSCYYYFSFG